MKQAVNRFILKFTTYGDRIAIVKFNESAFELWGLESINVIENKIEMIEAIPTLVGGDTCIGCGIGLAVEVFANINKLKNVMQYARIVE